MPLSYPTSAGLLMAAIFLLVGLLTGAWKYSAMRRDPDARAPVYVDIAHRAALLYAYAMTLLSLLTLRTSLADHTQVALLGVLAASFAFAVASYVAHGLLRDTDNQFRKPYVLGRVHLHSATADIIMVLKGSAELAATAWLIYGFWNAIPA